MKNPNNIVSSLSSLSTAALTILVRRIVGGMNVWEGSNADRKPAKPIRNRSSDSVPVPTRIPPMPEFTGSHRTRADRRWSEFNPATGEWVAESEKRNTAKIMADKIMAKSINPKLVDDEPTHYTPKVSTLNKCRSCGCILADCECEPTERDPYTPGGSVSVQERIGDARKNRILGESRLNTNGTFRVYNPDGSPKYFTPKSGPNKDIPTLDWPIGWVYAKAGAIIRKARTTREVYVRNRHGKVIPQAYRHVNFSGGDNTAVQDLAGGMICQILGNPFDTKPKKDGSPNNLTWESLATRQDRSRNAASGYWSTKYYRSRNSVGNGGTFDPGGWVQISQANKRELIGEGSAIFVAGFGKYGWAVDSIKDSGKYVIIEDKLTFRSFAQARSVDRVYDPSSTVEDTDFLVILWPTLTERERDIVQSISMGEGQASIAKRYKVNQSTISRALQGIADKAKTLAAGE